MLENERQAAVDVVRSVVTICRSVQGELAPGRWDKEDRSPVTVADLAVQAVVSGVLQDRFPQDPLMAEEGAAELRLPSWSDLLSKVTEHVRSVAPNVVDQERVLNWIERGQQPIDPERRYWVLDPVDGTKGFLRKEQYAIALALIERGEVLLGVLACPNLPPHLGDRLSPDADELTGQMYVAVRGEGAECLPLPRAGGSPASAPVHVTRESTPANLYWCERVEASSKNQDLTSQVVEQAGITNPPFRIDSQAKYAVVARGEAALYLRHTLDPDYREKVWDHAAGVLVMEEAGGRVTDLFGRPLDFSQGRQLSRNRGIVATNGMIHERVLAAVEELLPRS